MEQALLNFIRDVFNAIQWPGVVLLMAIESANIPLPSELIMPLSGWLLIKEDGLPVGFVLVAGFFGALGNVLGSLLSYWIGAWGGRPLLNKYGKYILISRHDLDRADAWFAKYGDWAVLISRVLPVVRTFISFPAGIARTNLRKFVLLTFLGSFPWSAGLAYGGYLLGEHYESIRSAMRPLDIPIAVVIAALIVWYVVRHVRRSFSEG